MSTIEISSRHIQRSTSLHKWDAKYLTEEVSTKVEVPDSGSNSIHSDAEAERRAFLSTFSPDEDKAIRRKVYHRFLWLIGLMYTIKNIDYTNATVVKVLQVGKPTNIMTQLKMTADEYNWVQLIYFIAYIVFEVPTIPF
ncbi:hypothetical protein IFR04_013092 [Cadophora malorum]|uniref:Uncharacterized protein n=1 Tax=Cadophora malorum TaxID=108018 RepID=A0A8H7T7M3_9HELO|nr:hypothetical protein IFR04_013092 [Cadophora malorum]